MPKTLNDTTITNDLRESAFFRRPTGVPDKSAQPTSGQDRPKPTVEPIDPSVEPIGMTGRTSGASEGAALGTPGKGSTVLDELLAGSPADARRPTERYAFEIYTDLKARIEEIQYKFKRRTGKKLPASRIIREALEMYLHTLSRQLD